MSHVALTTHRCPVCGKIHSRNADVLLHRRLKDIAGENTLGLPKLCEEHFKEGFICIIEADRTDHGYTTLGPVVYIKNAAAQQVFPDIGTHEFVFSEAGMVARVNAMVEEA